MNKLTQLLIIAGIVSVPLQAMADGTAPAAAPSAPTLTDVLGASGVSLTGYFDVAYNSMNSTGLFTSNNGTPTPANTSAVGGAPYNSHIFDTPGATPGKDYSAFNMQQFAVIIAKQPKEGFGGLVNLTAGQDAATVASQGLGAAAGASHSFDLTQAYGSYATGPLTVIGGKFVTLAGAELITSPLNSNYTRAWMFGWGPYTHTGVRATYAASDMITLIAGVNNGFDQVNSQTGGKTAEFGLDITPNSMFSLANTYYQGKGMIFGATGTGKYFDSVGTFNATSKLNFVADYANASQDGATLANGLVGLAKWHSLALYANYHFNDMWRISYRNENFDDPNGFRSGIAQRLRSNTLTLGFAPTKAVELRGEIRQDKSSDPTAFLQTNGLGKDSQMTYAMEAIYQF